MTPATHRRGETGQTMPLILGVLLILSLGTVMLVQNTFEQFPIVTKSVIQHQAYRAMVSGLDEYLYAVNANGNFAACNAKFVNGSGTTVGNSALTSASSVCSALSFGTWTSVPGSGAANGPPSWFLVDNPSINTVTGNLSINIVGASGYPKSYNYQSAVVTLQPLNGFLLNVLWINYNQVDPPVVAQYGNNGTPTCTYYWSPSPDSLGNNCQNVEFIAADSLTGNLFVNDSIWLCGSPTFQNVQTADPAQNYIQECSGSPTVTGTWTHNVGLQPIPSDNSALSELAQHNGCDYQGPTTIVLTGTTMKVTSPGTPTGLPVGAPVGSSSNDRLNDPANTTNVCMPASPGGSVALPANGVIYVDNCGASYVTVSGGVTKCNGQSANPLSAAGETGVGGTTVGDAIVQGTITTPTTIGSDNNIVIDGNLCYTDTLSAGKCTTNAPAAPSTNVLGLVALNYVELNHPVSGGNNVGSVCTTSTTPGTCTVTSDLQNPVVDAVILALNHSFLVNNYNVGSPLGTINLNGTIDQNWRGPVGTNSGGSINHGYAKDYEYDGRLIYLSPPYYLNPGTSQWGFASFTVVAGACKTPSGAYASACTGYP